MLSQFFIATRLNIALPPTVNDDIIAETITVEIVILLLKNLARFTYH